MTSRAPEAGRFLRREGNVKVRRDRMHRTMSRGLGRIAWIAALVAVLSLGVGFGWRWLVTTPYLAVSRIDIEGAEYAETATLRSLASGAMARNLISLDLAQVADNIGTHPWVRRVVVRRRIPDTLVIRVEERRPLALALMGEEIYLLDAAGTRIDRYGPRYTSWSFPVFRGIDDLEPSERIQRCRRAARQLQTFREAAPELYDQLAEADLSDTSRVVLWLAPEGEVLWVDPENWTNNLDEYRAMRVALAERHGRMRHVDLRWDGHLAVLPDNLERTEEHG